MKCAYAPLALSFTSTNSKEPSNIGMGGYSPAQGRAQRSALICMHPKAFYASSSTACRSDFSAVGGRKRAQMTEASWRSCTMFEGTMHSDLQMNIHIKE